MDNKPKDRYTVFFDNTKDEEKWKYQVIDLHFARWVVCKCHLGMDADIVAKALNKMESEDA